MLQFDVECFVPLLTAFDRAGRRMFDTSWLGTEAFAHPTNAADDTRPKRAAIVAELKSLAVEAAPYQELMSLPLSAWEHQAASDALANIQRRQTAFREALTAMPETSEAWLGDQAAFKRREAVEAEFREAFASGTLHLVAPNGTLVDWKGWPRQPDFRLYFGLSLVRVPRSLLNLNRRLPVFIDREELNQWLSRFGEFAGGAAKLTSKALCLEYLAKMVRTYKPKERQKAFFQAEAIQTMPGLSVREFNHCWAATVPETWKASGPKRAE